MAFRLPLIFYLMAVLAALLATFEEESVISLFAWAYFAFVAIYLTTRPARLTIVDLLSIVAIIGLLVALLLPAVQMGTTTTARSHCRDNLTRIAAAMNAYEQQYGTLPPAYVADEAGTPLHSWRVLLLPFLGEQALYDRYRFDEPWNGPHNIKLLEEMPDTYLCYFHLHPEEHETAYVVVVGEQTAFPGPQGRPMSEIRDGLSKTLLAVETVDPIAWLEPHDLSFTDALKTMQAPCFSSQHRVPQSTFFTIYDAKRVYEGNVAFADGNAKFVHGPVTSESLAALLTVNGNEATAEPIRVDESQRIQYRPNYRRIVSLTILVLLLLMPLVWQPWKILAAKSEAS